MKNYLVRDVEVISYQGDGNYRDTVNAVSEDIAHLIGMIIDYYGIGYGLAAAVVSQSGVVAIDGDNVCVRFRIYEVGDYVSDDEIEYALQPYIGY